MSSCEIPALNENGFLVVNVVPHSKWNQMFKFLYFVALLVSFQYKYKDYFSDIDMYYTKTDQKQNILKSSYSILFVIPFETVFISSTYLHFFLAKKWIIIY